LFHTADMLRIFQIHRGDAIVVPGRGGRHWATISTRPNRDAPVGDPAMGGHASFALGLALARPNDKVVLFDSEGDLLDEPRHPADHRGAGAGQLLPLHARQRVLRHHGRAAGAQCQERRLRRDCAGCGYPRAFAFEQLEEFQANIASILGQPGPVFVALKVLPEVENVPIGQRPRWQTRTRVRVLEDLRAARHRSLTRAELGIAP
jgi:thiamine pyrophosphate-dependent acetolactate synthase large subunit-like protein